MLRIGEVGAPILPVSRLADHSYSDTVTYWLLLAYHERHADLWLDHAIEHENLGTLARPAGLKLSNGKSAHLLDRSERATNARVLACQQRAAYHEKMALFYVEALVSNRLADMSYREAPTIPIETPAQCPQRPPNEYRAC